jgi:chromosome segregation ATPase
LYFGGISGLDSYLKSYNEAKGQYDSNLSKQSQLELDIEELEEICNQYTNDIEKLNRYKSILNKEFYNQYCNFI